MLQYDDAKRLYDEIAAKMADNKDEDLQELYEDFLKAAAEYAKTRLSWSFMDLEARRADDGSRSMKHEAFMARLIAVCRNLGIEGIEDLMPERKSKGDFACYVAAFLALEQR